MKRFAKWAGSLLAVYLLMYTLNSILGGYWMKPVSDGTVRYSFGLSIPVAIMWQPRLGYATPLETNLIGYAFYPLIRFDQRFVHPTRYLTVEKDEQWFFSESAAKDAHPHFQSEPEAEPGEARNAEKPPGDERSP